MPSLPRTRPSSPAVGRRLLALVLAVPLVIAFSGVATLRAAGTTMTLDPSSGPAGTTIHVDVSGIGTRSTLAVRWDDRLITMAARRQTRATFSATVVAPTAAAGAHRVAVTDRLGRVIASGTFTLLLLAATASPVASPSQSTPPGPSASVTPTPVPTPSAVPTPPATAAPSPSAAPTPSPLPTPAAASVRWALIGNDGTRLDAERAAGLTTKVFELSWSAYEPADGAWSTAYVDAKRGEAASLRAAGFTLILSFGVQYAPSWVMARPDARYVDQNGLAYDDATPGSGRANFVWNDALRALQARYVARVFADLGTDWAAVRIGGGRYGELGYPVASTGAETNTYWAFDANAARSNPVPGWKPGMASPNGEAAAFARWYLDRLADYAAWQARTVRASYSGRIMLLLPSFGIRPGQLDAAVAANLAGTTSAERNGEVQRGYDYARQIEAVSTVAAGAGIVPTTTWLDCPFGSDGSTRAVDWSPVHYIASLAGAHGMAVYGENTGQGTATTLAFTVAQAKAFGLIGFAWYKEAEVYSGSYATIDDIARVIAGS